MYTVKITEFLQKKIREQEEIQQRIRVFSHTCVCNKIICIESEKHL